MSDPSPIANFARVDDFLWRGARPDDSSGAQWLAAGGVKTAINLEWEQSDDELFAGTQIFRVRLADWEPNPAFFQMLEDRHIRYLLSSIRSYPNRKFVHCRSGQNRTGIAVAAYRLIIKNDPVDAVVADMRSFGGIWAHIDEKYIRDLAERKGEFL